MILPTSVANKALDDDRIIGVLNAMPGDDCPGDPVGPVAPEIPVAPVGPIGPVLPA
jgi:hypothetical protein